MLSKTDEKVLEVLRKEGKPVSTTRMTKLLNMRRKHTHKILENLSKIGEVKKMEYFEVKEPERFEKEYYDIIKKRMRKMIGIVKGNYWVIK